MSDTRIFSVPDGGSSMAPLIASLCQNRGLDPNMVAAMMNNNRGNGGWGDMGAWWIVILLIFGWGGFGNGFGGGFGGRGSAQGLADLGNLVNNDAGRELLMSAIQGNGTAISQLASTVHCDLNALQGSIQNLSTQLGQLGLGQRDIITAIMQGNNSILSKLCDCCCSVKTLITEQGYQNQLATVNQTNVLQGAINAVATGQERGFSALAFENERQTCALKGAINDGTQAILQGQRDAVMREMQNKIDALREENSTFKASAMTSQIVGQATAPLGAALADLSSRLAKIECNQPPTFPMPYCPASGNYIPVSYGVNVNPFQTYNNCGC